MTTYNTSGTVDWMVNEGQIYAATLKVLRKLGEGETISPETYQDCRLFMNALLKQWQGRADYAPGLKMWSRRIGFLFQSTSTGTLQAGPAYPGWTNAFSQTTLTAGAAAGDTVINVATATIFEGKPPYSPTAVPVVNDHIGIILVDGSLFWTTVSSVSSLAVTLATALPKAASLSSTVFFYETGANQPIVVEVVNLRNPNKSDQLLRPMTMQRYQALPAKQQPANIAQPTAYYAERQLTYTNLYTTVDATNDATWYLVVEYMQETEDLTQATQNPAFPKEWFRALIWGLAKEIAPLYNATWSEVHEMNYVQALKVARNVEPETTEMYFSPYRVD
jgi:hypothetical protein